MIQISKWTGTAQNGGCHNEKLRILLALVDQTLQSFVLSVEKRKVNYRH